MEVNTLSFGQMQKAVYDYVLSKMEGLPSNARFESENDAFWVSEFDDLFQAFERDDLELVLEEIDNSICAVVEKIINYYQDRMNHPTGYKSINLEQIEAVHHDDLIAIASKIDTKIVEKYIENQKLIANFRKRAADVKLKKAKSKIEEIATFIKKYNDAGWADMKKHLLNMSEFKFNVELPDGVYIEAALQMSAVELKTAYSKMLPEDYLSFTLWNLENLRLDREEEYLTELAHTLKGNKASAKKLVALL